MSAATDPVTAPAQIVPVGAAAVRARMAAYVTLTKPRIIELLLVTTVPPMVLAAGGWPGLWPVVATLLGGTLVAAAANAYNMVLERDIDTVMARTRSRPLPSGTITVRQAVVFATALCVGGTAWLSLTVGRLPALLTLSALGFYVGVYTAWLKRRSTQNIVIGGAAGAVPVLVGWAVVTGTVGAPAWVLFAVVFFWTPPHFWALAIVYERDYAAAGIPMLPVLHGRAEAARRSRRYAALTVGASLALPLVDPRVNTLYIIAAALLGALFLMKATRLCRDPRSAAAHRLFTFSIVYLAALFAALVIDQMVRFPGS